MDNLIREMRLCEKAGFGVSYGKWKATQPLKEKPKVEKGCCECCGKRIPPGRAKRFCSDWCRAEAGYKKRKQIPAYDNDPGYDEEERKCAWCGRTFPLKKQSKKYCSNNCCALARYYRIKEAKENGND